MPPSRLGLAVVVLVLNTVGLGVAGCSSGNPAPAPQFTGPYASELQKLSASTKDKDVKAAVADGKITRAENDAAFERYVACMGDQGAPLRVNRLNGDIVGFVADTKVPDQVFDAADLACRGTAQDLTVLYKVMTSNPQHEDVAVVVVRCLKKVGLVGPEYSAEQYKEDVVADSLPFQLTDSRARPCV